MWHAELTGAAAGFAERVQPVAAVGGKAVHARVTVTVRDKEISREADRDIRREIERPGCALDRSIVVAIGSGIRRETVVRMRRNHHVAHHERVAPVDLSLMVTE
jgi:hypothetical protein